MKNFKSVISVASLITATLFFNQVCQSQAPVPTAAPAAAVPSGTTPATAPASGAPDIKGKASFAGTPPVAIPLKRNADPFCAKTAMTDQEVLVNANKTLKNVVIRVIKGAAPSATPPATPIVINQDNCMYSPRVVAGMSGQKLLIKNADPIMHNVHSYVGTATGFNQAQMKGSKDIEKTIGAGITKFKCDVHPWMTGYMVGNDTPYVCVTGDTGECSLGNVPNGTYTVEAWHEKYGAKTVDVTVAGGVVNADFTFGQ